MEKETIYPVKEKAKEKGITHEVLAAKLEVSRGTLNSRFEDGKWKKSQKATLKKMGLYEDPI